MRDKRLQDLAKTLLHHSVEAKKDEVVYIQFPLHAKPLVTELLKEINEIQAIPRVVITDPDFERLNMLGMNEKRLEKKVDWTKSLYEEADCAIRIESSTNDYSSVDVPASTQTKVSKAMRPVSDIMIKKRWVLLDYPTPSQAQNAKMSNEVYEDFVMDACSIDYARMNEALKPLKDLMERTDKVRITAPNTDLVFSIKNMPAIPCAGENNIPDGEIFTAPIIDSVNGVITYNTPSPQRGDVFSNVTLTFEDGKVVNAKSETGNQETLLDIFNTDDGARFIGEFALGVHPLITKPMGNILFDEKIAGSIHFTPGMAYEECDNGNVSAVHWDLVLIQTADFGGGEIYFDDVLIRKDGIFVLEELKGLNPENL